MGVRPTLKKQTIQPTMSQAKRPRFLPKNWIHLIDSVI